MSTTSYKLAVLIPVQLEKVTLENITASSIAYDQTHLND
jgi:hypothetical protein